MHKFKVGDRVKILDGSKIQDYAGRWICIMGNFVGRETTIESMEKRTELPAYRLDGIGFVWDERGLELVEENETVVICRRDSETIAIRKDNGKEVKRAVAKCSPYDTYDFQTGAKLAMDRLFEPEKPKGYTHKIVCISSSGVHFTLGKIYEAKEGELKSDLGRIFRKGSIDTMPYKNIDEINEDLSSQFIELVEEE